MKSYVQGTMPRRPGSDDFRDWPSRVAPDRVEPYAPPAGILSGSPKSPRPETEAQRKRGVAWRYAK